ncbi:hypothetical protein CI109_105653 [Kwoniella shandongensis]|uniref:Uncharacterized protein n=1 Tax=Kwoniella shandongensis TaxID=1734106 RepID=A0A5M6C3F5_9TREE|nr:uncharacterized protein CI109_002369 [Kwoniella shandongensis]KAA5529473.1 hypothetical protein CI109_002369 [Kwoniella shandongensis]
MGPHNKSIRVNWDDDPRLTLRLLNLIAANGHYRSCLYGNASPGERWRAERDLCIEILGGEPWMQDKAEKGWVVQRSGRWVPTDAWTSGVMHPVRNRLSVLAKRMDSGWYEMKFGLDPRWNSERDIPWDKQAKFAQSCPYYFTLRQLSHESRASKSVPVPGLPAHAESSAMAQAKRPAAPSLTQMYATMSPQQPQLKRSRMDDSYNNMQQYPQGMLYNNGGMDVHAQPAELKRGRGRPPGTGKYQIMAENNGPNNPGIPTYDMGIRASVAFAGTDLGRPVAQMLNIPGPGQKRGRGRPPGSGKKKVQE